MGAFNPLDTDALTKVFVNELTSRPAVALPELDPTSVQGPGLYALYYTGAFGLYRSLAKAGTEWPIYLGSAMPSGSRTGRVRTGGKSPILDRLERHTESITHAENLEEGRFHARWLEVDEPFIILGEILLMRLYRPLWNSTLSGFGAKVVGRERTTGRVSQWDTVHPGRPGRGTTPGKTLGLIEIDVEKHLSEFPPGWSLSTPSSAHAASDR
jgi:Eco29kI restriction endonuclease